MTPYRHVTVIEPPKPRWWKRPLCWVNGHLWEMTRRGPGFLSMLHPLAGCDAYCLRCGETWLNYDAVQRINNKLFARWSHDE